ncbi:DUF2231 domain-containing protein [Terracoccus luteus]|uniref:DUF2231 domain-containing protein n=1 Tax=Terracoccus luteus TaxID=53356 RepID=A0A839PYF3_9MICO|nr:DUF2231 domain-containing protein [Terracoccus luteus]MBB2987734.1 hypothetical protein [Terracoccus luteus]MCP2173385.1 hypothetical protein [Terracoccus luteus]
MFDYFLGLPMHALVLHAVVVLVPLSALVALAFAARPAWRRALRWPLVAGSLVSGVTAWVAAESGEALEKRVVVTRASSTNFELLSEHTEWGDRAEIVCAVFLVVGVVAAFLLRAPRRGADTGSGTGAASGGTATRSGLQVGVAVVLAVVAVAALAAVAVAGHAGSAVVWDGLA